MEKTVPKEIESGRNQMKDRNLQVSKFITEVEVHMGSHDDNKDLTACTMLGDEGNKEVFEEMDKAVLKKEIGTEKTVMKNRSFEVPNFFTEVTVHVGSQDDSEDRTACAMIGDKGEKTLFEEMDKTMRKERAENEKIATKDRRVQAPKCVTFREDPDDEYEKHVTACAMLGNLGNTQRFEEKEKFMLQEALNLNLRKTWNKRHHTSKCFAESILASQKHEDIEGDLNIGGMVSDRRKKGVTEVPEIQGKLKYTDSLIFQESNLDDYVNVPLIAEKERSAVSVQKHTKSKGLAHIIRQKSSHNENSDEDLIVPMPEDNIQNQENQSEVTMDSMDDTSEERGRSSYCLSLWTHLGLLALFICAGSAIFGMVVFYKCNLNDGAIGHILFTNIALIGNSVGFLVVNMCKKIPCRLNIIYPIYATIITIYICFVYLRIVSREVQKLNCL